MISSSEVRCVKVFCTIQLGEDILNLGYGPDELLGDFAQSSIIDDKVFFTISP